MTDDLFDYLPRNKILAALNRAPGNEISSAKLSSPESSSALAVNTFGFFLERPEDLPTLPGTEECGWPAISVSIEECCRFPWRGGHHPWLDAFVETKSCIIGIESKRYEPFRAKAIPQFSEAYWRPVWGEAMQPFEQMRDDLVNGDIEFEFLDAAQLVKHAFGLRTEGQRRSRSAVLVYLYAEPEKWPDGRLVDTEWLDDHRSEIELFTGRVEGAEVAFSSCSYDTLLDTLRDSSEQDVQNHASNITMRFGP